MGLLRNIWGRNTATLAWVEGAVIFYNLTGYTCAMLYFVATNTCFKLWRRFCMSIDGAKKILGCSRSSVEKALKVLRDLKLISYDGQMQSGKGRPFAAYRLTGTPECPLPEWVVDAREQDREAQVSPVEEDAPTCAFTYRTNTTEAAVTETPVSETPDSSHLTDDWGSQYRSASPIRTGPPADRRLGGSVRRPSHLRWLRRLAEGLLARRGAPVPGQGPQGLLEAAGGGMGLSLTPPKAVTYCHPPTRGAVVQPFIDPAFGRMPRDTRLLYLGLREAHTTGERTYAETLFLKSQFFPYDTDIDHTYLQAMVDTLVAAGKIHVADGDIVLSDPPTMTEVTLFDLTDKYTGHIPLPKLGDPVALFDEFWKVYPRRQGKGAARKAFLAAVARKVDGTYIITCAARYAENCRNIGKEMQFIPYPSVWLNQERWEDDPEQAPQVRSRMDDALRSGMDLVSYYQQQESIPFDDKPKLELDW